MSAVHFSRIIRKRSKAFYEDSAQATRQLEESLNMMELNKERMRETGSRRQGNTKS
jgi:hypothetical protein